jgi:hypothetical protein
MAAPVPDPRQRVVLGEDGEPGSALAAAGAEGRLQAADAPLQGKALAFEVVGEPARGLLLLERDLRVGVNAKAEFDELAA